MNTQNNNIKIYALTDSHQEARKLCCLFSRIVADSSNDGNGMLICDGGDLFKGIYDRRLMVDSYLQFKKMLPDSHMVVALGNNDFGFNNADMDFLQKTVAEFKQSGINVICSNLKDKKTGKTPDWIEPYDLWQINGKKILITAFCINTVKLSRYNLELADSVSQFAVLIDIIKSNKPDAVIIINHDLKPSSYRIKQAAQQNNIDIDLIVGGHEHSVITPDAEVKIYYPKAYSRSMMEFVLDFDRRDKVTFIDEIDCKQCVINPVFERKICDFEEEKSMNMPIAKSTLNLERYYSSPSSIGTFIADQMQKITHADIGFISTGYISHALRYEQGKILTLYNVERAFSADVPLQIVNLSADQIRSVFNNALCSYYLMKSGNTRFLQCSHNVCVECHRSQDNRGEVVQIYINGEPLFDNKGNALYPQRIYTCAVDPYVGSGEIGFDVMREIKKEYALIDGKQINIKELFLSGIIEAETEYEPGTDYPTFRINDISNKD